MKKIMLLGSHALMLLIGFVMGIYLLPILTAPASPDIHDIQSLVPHPVYTAQFSKDLKGSDLLHWGEGTVYIGEQGIAFAGSIAPGPDYRLYLAPGEIETKQEFLAAKDRALQVGHIRTFDNFIVPFDSAVDIHRYNTVVVWCESFSQFITAGEYRP